MSWYLTHNLGLDSDAIPPCASNRKVGRQNGATPSMQPYRDLSRNSGVTHYQTGDDYIMVKFRGDKPPYRYSYASAGKQHVDRMKTLAAAGRGLGTYISQHVHDRYEGAGKPET